ncbi:MAG: HDOD domain-containing protein [Phycisphaeraceae bacterium]|nr:HDOD domain-containing protein [Phycisphaeraceae bacterium]
MDPQTIERVLSCKKLPSLPAVAMRVVELTQTRDVKLAELAQTIQNDQGLSSKVLRTVNSSFYALRKPCGTINQAIVFLGLNAVKTLALGFSLASAIQKKGDDGFDYKSYWRRGLFSGVAAKCIAVESRGGYDEECFLGGLLQDVGMVALFQALGDEYLAVLKKTGGEHRQLLKHETADLELTHPEIGAMLVTRWKLPPELVMPVRFHERPTAAPAEYLRICQTVALGNIVCDVLCAAEPALVLKRFYERAAEWMHLTPAQCDAVVRRAQEGAREIGRLLDVDATGAADADDLIARAHGQLANVNVLCAGTGETIDPVTGLPDRAAFNQSVTTAYAALNSGRTLSVAFFSIDAWARVSTMNARVAEGLLAQVSSRLARHYEAGGGRVFRFDDTRLAAIVPNVDRLHAARLAEEARALTARTPFHVQPAGLMGTNIDTTLSAGLACVDAGTISRLPDADALIDTALRALASAQAAGENSMRVFAPKAAA